MILTFAREILYLSFDQEGAVNFGQIYKLLYDIKTSRRALDLL